MTEEIKKLIIYTRKMKKREPLYRDYPEEFREEIRGYLESNHISRLYAHQVEMFEKVRAGENVVITTSTASGKTLAFLLPVLQEILEDPLTRAIFIYPTKALASDQYRAMQSILKFFGEGRVSAGVYDGDTKPAERTRIRKSANIILTNPEMLNSAFLPNHSNYGFDAIFANLRYVVIDELHSYRGAFGAHLANIFRRMHRICRYYHSNPHFLCSSATIANPVELAEKICGSGFTLIDRDGSPAPEKEYCIIQPPEIKGNNDKVYGRIAASTVAAGLIPELVEEDHHFITFGRSRRNVEVILKEAKDKLDAAGFLGMARVGGKNPADLIAGYRGGYTPLERKEIERKMTEGELAGLVSTNALELGIDIGKLDATVIVGYPGTRASFWQQSGRAGRSGSACVNYLILENEPFDQYIAIDPEWLFSRESENAIVDPDNLLIELAHLRAAAAEMPLSLDDIALFPDLGEMIPVLLSAGEVKSLAGRFAWAGPAFPAGDYSLRNMDKTRFKLLAQEDGHEITEMDESQAYHEIHPGALLYDTYTIEELRCDSNKGMTLIPAFDVVVSRNKVVVDLGTLTDEYEPEIIIHTTATDKVTGGKSIVAGKSVTIVDTVTLDGLTKGTKYQLKGWQMVKSENAQLLIDGEPVENDYTFTAKKSEMEVEVSYTFNASALGGKDLVTFEELYDLSNPDEPTKVAEHKDIEDEGQTVTITERIITMHTTATDKATGEKTIEADDKVTIVDTVTLDGLEKGVKYTLKGWEMVKSENAELLMNGKRVENDLTFTAEDSKMEVQIEFTFNASELGGKELVTFEELYDVTNPDEPIKVAEHKDIKDKGQTVTVKENLESPTAPEEPSTPTKTSDSPKTGDNTPFVALFAMMGISAAGLIFAGYKRFRRVKKSK